MVQEEHKLVWGDYVAARKQRVLQKYAVLCRWLIRAMLSGHVGAVQMMVLVTEQYHQEKISIADVGYLYQAVIDRVEICGKERG